MNSFVFARAAMIFLAMSAAASAIACEASFRCTGSQILEQDVWLRRYPELSRFGSSAYEVHFCKAKEDEHLLKPISNTKFTLYDRDCKKIAEGEYGDSGPKGLVHSYWPNGSARLLINYDLPDESTKSRFDERWYDDQGSLLRMPIGLLEANTSNGVRAIAFKTKKENREHFAQAQRDSVRICDPYPEVIFDVDRILTSIREAGLSVAYLGETLISIAVATTPVVDRAKREAALYRIKAEITDCRNEDESNRYCNISIAAWKQIAPISSDGHLELSRAVNLDDALTQKIISHGDSLVEKATTWCSVRRIGIPRLRWR